jgi:hypothetical protein
MNSLELWTDYKNTMQFLNRLHEKSKKSKHDIEIPCKPAFKIVEDEMVVGILTETDQFIQLSEPIAPMNIDPLLDLPSITDQDYIVNAKAKQKMQVDVYTATNESVDVEREDYIRRIKLETNFYNVFRNSIRLLLNHSENHTIREEIESVINNYTTLYTHKLEKVTELLYKLVKKRIQFIGDDQFYKLIKEVSTCIVKDTDTCSSEPSSANICVSKNNKCNMILPVHNLITGKKNESIYYGKIADELIRYNRIKNFMFEPQTYLSFGNIGYNLRDNEIILIQSLLNNEYFDRLVPAVNNKYIKHNNHDQSQPIITQHYDNTITNLNYNEEQLECVMVDNQTIKTSMWKSMFPSNYVEVEYGKTIYCTYAVMIDLIEKHTGEKYTMNDIKNQLHDEYKQYLLQYKQQLTSILILEGKKTLGDQVLSNTLSFSNMIYSDTYYLTTFDYWLLLTKHRIPTIFISQKPLAIVKPLKKEDYHFVAFVDATRNSFTYIIVPSLRPENIPGFKVVKTPEGETPISLDVLHGEKSDSIHEAIRNPVSIQSYLETFEILKTKKIVKRVVIKQIEDSQEPGKPDEPQEEPRKPDEPQEEPGKPDEPQEEPRKQEEPQEEPSKPEEPQDEPRKQEEPQEEPEKQEEPQEEPSKPEEPQEEPSKPEEPQDEPRKQEEPQEEPEKQKRCPIGYLRNKKTKLCEPKNKGRQPEEPKPGKPDEPQEEPEKPEEPKEELAKSVYTDSFEYDVGKRCPNGYVRNKKTKKCEPKTRNAKTRRSK